MRGTTFAAAVAAAAVALGTAAPAMAQDEPSDLWQAYTEVLSKSRYIDLTHTLTPFQPVWKGFGPSSFSPTLNPLTGQPYTFAADGFEATAYQLSTDQFGTQLDPPAHWAPEYPAIDELPATYAVRPLVVISIVKQLKTKGDYHLQVADITAWEKKHGRIPEGSVVMVRSDWSKKWTTDPVKAKALAAETVFPGVSLKAIQFLHQKRHILFHGHEPLDTDTTPTLEGEAWLMHNGYTQAEGVNNLSAVPETGCLVSIGFPKFGGGVGGYARYIAICPPDTKGAKISRADAPMKKKSPILHWDAAKGMRVR
ncbi:cyclase family protein [Solirubrobacter taibaiensis]|nr:cyclase family protein [Solirubrobacter taibaiensis]